MYGFLGMRGTGDWATDQRPKNWRETILYLYPNGSAPLTAILSKMKEEKVDDPEFNWWTKQLAQQGGAVVATEIYTDATMATKLAAAGTLGQVLYVKVAEAVADEFRAGHQCLLRDTSDYSVDVVAKVMAVQKNGASSCITVKLLEADDNSTSHDLRDADRILIIGNINPEGGSMPEAIGYDPVKLYNKTQILRTPLSITRTARLTRLRTGDAYKEMKREALELHSIELEKAFLWSVMTENIGANGKPERTMDGLIPVIKTSAAANCDDFTLNTSYSGQTWLQGGEEWFDLMLEQMFRYGRGEKLAFAGSGALLGINRLAKSSGQIQLNPQTTSYGLKVVEWMLPMGTIYVKTHPLFSYEVTNRNSMVIFEPEDLLYKYITDTSFYAEGETQNTGYTRRDGTDEEYLTECSLEYHHPIGWGYLNGIGLDNNL
jgi:hypothetical protein